MAPQPGSSWEIIGKKGHWERIAINPISDGLQRTWPPKPYRPSSDERYLIQLAEAWTHKLGLQQQGVQFYFDKLPDGYATFEINQPSGPQVYKRLFGHPSGKFYDSIVRFKPHFIWLMSEMEGDCECINCGHFKREGPPRARMRNVEPQAVMYREMKKLLPSYDSDVSSNAGPLSTRGPLGTSSRPQRQVRTAGTYYAQDTEGTEDIYKSQLKTLEGNKDSTKGIEDDIREPNSLDWRAEHSWVPPNAHDWPGTDLIQQSLTSIEHQHTFIPRVGELVLFCPTFLDQHYLMLDEKSQEYKFYSFEQKCFHGFPTWRGGVVAAVPSKTAADGPIDFPDIQDLPKKHNSLNTGGFRIETFPDPNNAEDKTASKQYRYLPLRNIRPMSQWQLLLRGIARTNWHASIEHALTCMTSISLLEKFYFKGSWEKEKQGTKKAQASIRCKGIYLGAELITLGDTVRIMPEQTGQPCTDVLVVESIRLQLSGITPEHFLPETPLLSTQSYITLVGKAYTTDKHRHAAKAPAWSRSSQPTIVPADEVKTLFRPVGSALYGPWYTLHAPEQRYEISHDQVLGRLCEGAAVHLWTGAIQRRRASEEKHPKPSLEYDLSGIEKGRVYAMLTDGRLDEPGKEPLLWYWADTRAEALDLQTINGVEVGRYDKVRDKHTLEDWKQQMRLLNGLSVDTIAPKFTNFAGLDLDGGRLGTRGRPPGSKVINGKLYRAGEIPPGYENQSDHGEPRGDFELTVQLTPSKHKESRMAGAALVSTDEDDEEDHFEDAEEVFAPATKIPSKSPVPQRDSPVPRPKPKQPKAPKTKAEIMAGAADEESFSDDEDDFMRPMTPPLRKRGEEEESDYDPGS